MIFLNNFSVNKKSLAKTLKVRTVLIFLVFQLIFERESI